MLIRSAQLGLLAKSWPQSSRSPHEKNILTDRRGGGPASTFYLNDSVLLICSFFFQNSVENGYQVYRKSRDFIKPSSEKVSVFIWLTWSILYCYLWRRSLDTESCTWPLVSTAANIAFTVLKCIFCISFFISNVAHDIMIR